MAVPPSAAANALAGLLGSAAKWATILGLGGSLLQTSMYTGACLPSALPWMWALRPSLLLSLR
jgi:hypothetical protein